MILYMIIGLILIRVLIAVADNISLPAIRIKRKIKYKTGLFVNNFIDSKTLFATRYGLLPSLGVITETDSTKAYAFILEKLSNDIKDIHQLNIYDHKAGDTYFSLTILELAHNRMIEIGVNYIEILYTSVHYNWAMQLLKELAACKAEVVMAEEKAPTIVGFARSAELN